MRRSAGVLLLLATVAAACGGSEEGPAEAPALQSGDRAPDFTLPAADGEPVSLAGLRGQRFLMYFSMGPG